MSDVLKRHREIWYKKKILRKIYMKWYNTILGDLNDNRSKTIELGAGSGNFKDYKKDVIACDIVDCEWIDLCFDAHHMPFGNESIGNIVMIDVLHHLANPILFFKEAVRVLQKKGRIIILEPYLSPFSKIVYKLFHPEPFFMTSDYFSKIEIENKNPWDANQAVAYLLFYKYRKRFEGLFKNSLEIIKQQEMSCILYPASGGFEHKSLIPDFFIPFFEMLEMILTPLRFLMAFRCYIVLEKN
jgi:SAM-dependent methyltransferase